MTDTGLKCRLCNSPLSRIFVDLGMSPLSNSYLRDDQLCAMEAFLPLRTYVCDECKLVQLPEAERPEHIFASEYLYFSSYSVSWLEHAKRFAEMAAERFGLDSASLVVELASNDGYLLQYFAALGIPVLGIEPAANVAKVAVEQRHIPTRVEFFGRESASALVADGKRADLIVGNNVLAHVPDSPELPRGHEDVAGARRSDQSRVSPSRAARRRESIRYHLPRALQLLFISAAERAFATAGLTAFDVEDLSTHGGSLRVFVRHEGGSE